MTDAQVRAAHAAVETWLAERLGLGPGEAEVGYVPHLSLPHFACFVVVQRAVSSPAGDITVLSDGRQVLPVGRENLAIALRQEQLAGIPAARLAALYLRMAAPGTGRLIERLDDPALAALPPAERAAFAPPALLVEGDTAFVRFWVAGVDPQGIERRAVMIAADGTLAET